MKDVSYKQAINLLASHIECYTAALDMANLSREEIDSLFMVKLVINGAEIKIDPTPKNFMLIQQLLQEGKE